MHDFYVDTDVDPALEAATRFQSIKRWHMVDTCRNQSIAEHSANVALLAYYISMTSPINYFDGPATCALAALFHDLPEVFMGDIPTHTKKHLKGIKELEANLTPRMYEVEVSDNTNLLLKMCDLADGIRFIEKFGVDRVSIFAMNGLREQLQNKYAEAKSMWPEHVFNGVWDKIETYIQQ